MIETDRALCLEYFSTLLSTTNIKIFNHFTYLKYRLLSLTLFAFKVKLHKTSYCIYFKEYTFIYLTTTREFCVVGTLYIVYSGCPKQN